MRKGSGFFMAALFAASVAACGGDEARRDRANTPGAEGTSGRSEANLAMGERNFVLDQLREGQKEVQLGQLAAQRANHAQVKEFGRTMVQDHTKAGNELKQIASQANVQLDNERADAEARDGSERLSKLEGREFDREYIDIMVKDHEDAVDELQEQAQNAEHAGLRQWAASTLPKVKQHLEHAKQLQNQLNSDRSSQ